MRREANRGIILITTLLLLTLLAGFAIAAQNRALGQARVLDAVRAAEEQRVVLQSVWAVALPIVGEALSNGELANLLPLPFGENNLKVAVDPTLRSGWVKISISSVP